MKIATFWNEDHPLSVQSQALGVALVPLEGNCTTLQGELFRASSRIGYDWFNNGWGCNNWSGAVRFIEHNIAKLPNRIDDELIPQLVRELNFVETYSHGEPCHCAATRATFAVTKIHEIIVNAILNNPTAIPNTDDMFNYQEDDYRPPADDDDDWF
jgi:hypothetical protein